MDAWGAFYKATGRTETVVSGVSRLLANATLQPPLAENWELRKQIVSQQVVLVLWVRVGNFESVSGSMQIYI